MSAIVPGAAIVTGGGSGIGEGACYALARAGAAVAVVDVREQPAQAVASRIEPWINAENAHGNNLIIGPKSTTQSVQPGDCTFQAGI